MIKYQDQEFLKIAAYTLLFNVNSINQKLGSLVKLDHELNFGGVTNGKLYGVGFMAYTDEVESKLYDFITQYNFIEEEDYIFMESGMFFGIKHEIDALAYKEQPVTLEIPWISSILTPNGTYVWAVAPNISLTEKQQQNQRIQSLARSHPNLEQFEKTTSLSF
ncbi:hypothetical protein ACSVH5_02345 [Flavobacterium sp. RSSA_27]|uniref:hypothetical protein n=1 Tax=Flavobacterium sp. RSSA_27 TaxID=3447667 RepID=UPI003F2BA117